VDDLAALLDRYPPAWLGHHCGCPACRDPGTGQRLLDPPRARAFPDAHRLLAAQVARADAQVGFRLAPGDCLLLGTTPVRHARGAVTDSGAFTDAGTGGRHLQGCSATSTA
jgi:alpha-ketoglutarate-dependent taurine dioxygenase